MSDELDRARERLTLRRKALQAAKAQLKKAAAAVKGAAVKVASSRRTVKRLEEQTGPGAAVHEAEKHVGITETPPGSNRGPMIDRFQAAFSASRGFSWCGAFVGWCLKKAGVQGLSDRILYVPFIIEDARACRGPFVGFVGPTSIKRGDLVCMDFGGSRDVGEHVGLAVGPFDPSTRTVPTIEGNTSAGSSGSQSNGGGVFRRTRPVSVIVGGARPRYRR